MLAGVLASCAAPQAPAPAPSSLVEAGTSGDQIGIGNASIRGTWTVAGGHLRPKTLGCGGCGTSSLPLSGEVFTLQLADKKVVKASDLKLVGRPMVAAIVPDPSAAVLAERIAGQRISVTLEDADSNLQVVWQAIVRDNTKYLRQQLVLTARKSEIPISRIVMIDLPLRFPTVEGTVHGSPIVSDDIFCGIEHPMSESEILAGLAHCSLERALPLAAGQSFSCSSVIGYTQSRETLRRDFADYIECERAHPYRTFLHYNSWYDLGYFTPFNESDAVGVIDAYGKELVEKRGVTLDSFLFDDGWDDHHTLWGFNDGFKNGFTPVKEAAARYHAAPGVWMSPWGGYGKPRDQRLEYGKAQGFEINKDGYALSGPKYYERFHEVCLEMIRKFGINQFKFDGTGEATNRWPGSKFGSDFEAAIGLIEDLRREKPDLFVNLTTGTWPSPFWLRYADSIWRGGDDHTFAGVGSWRQRWITYRDADTYRGIVSLCRLYPLNSLMLHGIIYAKHAKHLDTDPEDDFASEVHSYFGSGTQLQEMYITPGLLSEKNWDTLAEAARWARANAATLRDSHWIGGDPGKGEVYGWASWSPEKGILVLRNPSDRPGSLVVNLRADFELPHGAAARYSAHSPWKSERDRPSLDLRADQPHTFQLKPFEVVTLEAIPAERKR